MMSLILARHVSKGDVVRTPGGQLVSVAEVEAVPHGIRVRDADGRVSVDLRPSERLELLGGPSSPARVVYRLQAKAERTDRLTKILEVLRTATLRVEDRWRRGEDAAPELDAAEQLLLEARELFAKRARDLNRRATLAMLEPDGGRQ